MTNATPVANLPSAPRNERASGAGAAWAGAASAISGATPLRRVADIAAATGGAGAAACLAVGGSDASLAFAAASLGFKGHLVIVGLAGGAIPFNFFGFPPEVVLTTSHWGTRNELEEVVALARQGRLQLEVERAPLDAINDVFRRLEHGEVTGRAVLCRAGSCGRSRVAPRAPTSHPRAAGRPRRR